MRICTCRHSVGGGGRQRGIVDSEIIQMISLSLNDNDGVTLKSKLKILLRARLH